MAMPEDPTGVPLSLTGNDVNDLVGAAWTWERPLGELEEIYEDLGEPFGAPEGEPAGLSWKFVYDIGEEKSALVLARMYLTARNIPHQFFWQAYQNEDDEWDCSQLLCTDYGSTDMHDMLARNKANELFRQEMDERFRAIENEMNIQEGNIE